jgi:hypothetical protein
VCRLLPLCLLHHSPEVRRAAVTASKAVVGAEPSLVGPLLAGLRHWANHTQDALVLVVSTCRAGGALALARLVRTHEEEGENPKPCDPEGRTLECTESPNLHCGGSALHVMQQQ